MKRRDLLGLVCVSLAGVAQPVRAQQTAGIRRIGYMDQKPANDPVSVLNREAFDQGLRELGWVSGKNIEIEFRSAAGGPEQWAAGAAEIPEFALRHRLASIYLFREQVALGGLISYGPNPRGSNRRAAAFVDKILRGADPAELPIEQAREFDLVINMKTAKALGLKLPQTVLLRATEVIE